MTSFWPIFGQTSLVVFLWKRRTSAVVFLATILLLMAFIRPLKTELVLYFHKNMTKLVFLSPNMSQKSFKALIFFYNLSNFMNAQLIFFIKLLILISKLHCVNLTRIYKYKIKKLRSKSNSIIHYSTSWLWIISKLLVELFPII